MSTYEKVETLNRRLSDRYGLYSDGRPLWRLVWSEDEMEKRHGIWDDYTSNGLFIRRVEEVREVPKYRQWINPPCFILERLLEIPEGVQTQLLTKTSYETVFTFRDKWNQPLPPTWRAIELIMFSVLSNAARAVGAKYEDPRNRLADPKIAAEDRLREIAEIEEELFGNETQISDALAYGRGIVVPAHYSKDN